MDRWNLLSHREYTRIECHKNKTKKGLDRYKQYDLKRNPQSKRISPLLLV